MSTPKAQMIDYLSLIFKTDHDYFQDHIAPALRWYAEMAQSVDAKPGGWHVNPRKIQGTNDTMYIVEMWGDVADVTALYMPLDWWLRCSRIDHRCLLASTTRQQLKSWGAEQKRRGVAYVNFTPRDTRDARKSNKRGSGGAGGNFGSRKSGKYIDVYCRLRETPAIEMRLGFPYITSLVRELESEVMADPNKQPYAVVCRLMWNERDKALKRWIGTHKIEEHIAQLAEEHDDNEAILQEYKTRQAAMGNGQTDFWSLLTDLGPGETDAFSLVQKT